MKNIKLIPVCDRQLFIKDIQKAFQDGYELIYGTYNKIILP